MSTAARRLGRGAAWIPLVAAVLLGIAWPASAHATLVSTNPAAGSVQSGPVRTVTVRFDESVGVSSDSLRVYSPAGDRVDVAGAHHTHAPDAVSVRLQPRLPLGTYTVAWQVVSADTHPVSGAFTFSIGHPSRHLSAGQVETQADRAVQVVYDTVRGLGFVGFSLFAGVMVVLAVCWPDGIRDRGARRVAWTGLVLTVVATLAEFLLQGIYAADAGFASLASTDLWGQTLGSRFGIAHVARAEFLIVGAGLLLVQRRVDTRRAQMRATSIALWSLYACGLAVTWSATGHASVGSQVPLAMVADVAHLVAAGVWIGGLMLLSVTVLRRPAAPSAWRMLGRFSTVALCCVLLIIATGVYQTWRNLGPWTAFVATDYGILLLAKIAGLCLLVGLGYLARRRIHRRLLGPPDRLDDAVTIRPRWNRLRRSVGLEVLVAVTVLGLTSVLVSTATGREAYRPVFATTQTFDTGTVTGTVHLTVTPATVGPQVVHITVSRSGRPYSPVEIDASLSLPAQRLGPLALSVVKDEPGEYHTRPSPTGIAGTWVVDITIRSDAFDETTVQATVPIR